MATKRYRKIWTRLILAGSLLLSLATVTEANAEQRVNGLSASDLLNGGSEGLTISAPQMPALRIQPPAKIAQETLVPTDDTFAPLSDDEIRQQLLLEPTFTPRRPRARPVPASSFLTPTAYGADWGDVYVGLAQVTAGKPANSNFDGSAAIGIGFGDAVKNVGLETSVSIISLNGFAYDGIVGFKLHKIFPQADNLAVAAGWSNPIKWGDARQREDNFYGVATKRFDLRPSKDNPLPLTASLGVGTGTFRSAGAIADRGNNSPNLFGSLGLRVIPELSLITSWTGSSLGLAASTAPLNFPLVLTIGVSDLTDNTEEGPRFNSTLGYSYSF